LHHLGFGKTFYGWPHHVDDFLAEAQFVQAERPNARFAVIGYGLGAGAARRFAAEASDMGIQIDAIFYLEPFGVEPWDEAEAARDVFTVRAEDLESPGSHRHATKSGVATHPATLEIIERELTLMAMGIPPPPRPRTQRVLLVPAIPAPREKIPIPKELPPEWQFLRPRHPWDMPPPAPRYGGETLPYPRALPDLPPPREVK
jgi:pimeloyl-ACP methyl ester carboxylesterase